MPSLIRILLLRFIQEKSASDVDPVKKLIGAKDFAKTAREYLAAPSSATSLPTANVTQQQLTTSHPVRSNLLLIGSNETSTSNDKTVDSSEKVKEQERQPLKETEKEKPKEDEFDPNSTNPKRFIRLNFYDENSPTDFKRKIISIIVKTTEPVRVLHNDTITIEYEHPYEALNCVLSVDHFVDENGVRKFSCIPVGKKNDDGFIKKISEDYFYSKKKKSFLLVAASVKVVTGGTHTLGHCTVPVQLDIYTWNQSFSVPMLPVDYIQGTKNCKL